jgi:hypothetical protein
VLCLCVCKYYMLVFEDVNDEFDQMVHTDQAVTQNNEKKSNVEIETQVRVCVFDLFTKS